jgi:arginyl-tRNA synthetase
MEDGDEEALALWRRFRDLSIVKYKETYARLNIEYDVYSGESQVGDGMKRALDMLHEMNLLQDSDGAKVIDLSKYKLGSTVVTKKDGTTLYLTRDIGAAMERYEKFKFDRMIYVVASQQDLHLKQLFKTIELMKFPWADRLQHINFGMVTGMSTRKGTVVFLDQILEETKEKMHDVMRKNEAKYAQIEHPEQVADEIGISAVKIQDNAARRIKNYEFDWERMFSFEGDTGPYLQYAHARLCSIERKSSVPINPNADISLLVEPTAHDLIRTIAQYPDLVKSLTNGLEPCNVVTYAFKLSHDVSSAFESLWVMGAEEKVAEARMLLYWSARVTLGNALRLLGLKPLERM